MKPLHGLLIAERSAATSPAVGPDAAATVPIANRPLASYAIDALARAGVGDLVVAGAGDVLEHIRPVLVDGASPRQLRWAELAPGEGLEAALDAATTSPDSPVLVHQVDCLFNGDLTGMRDRLERDRLDALVLLEPGAVPAGVQLLTPACLELAGELRETLKREPALEELASALVASRAARVDTAPVPASWRFSPEPDALLEVNRMVLETISTSVPPDSLTASEVQGRAHIHPTASVTGSLIRGPVVIGAGARIVDSYIGPYSAIGPRAVIEGAEIDHSVVHAGASIRHVGMRLESSVIGPHARVTRNFAFPKAMHLAVGAGAEVSLS